MRTRLCCFLALVASSTASADVFIESVFPPVLRRGEANRVRVVGSDMEGAVGLWTTLDQAGVSSQLIEESQAGAATFEIHVPDDAPLGLYGLRLATRDGFSNVHIFAIDGLASLAETEAVEAGVRNNRPEQAQAVSLPAAVVGTCGKQDVDNYAIDVEAGQTVSFEVIGNRLGKAFDPVLQIYDAAGNFIRERDNDVGLFFDCRFSHTFKQAGRYTVRLHDTRFLGSEHWTYVLRMGRFPVARVALPSTAKAGELATLAFPQTDCGPLEVAFPTELTSDRFFFELKGAEYDSSTWLPLAVSSLVNVVESEPNETTDQPTPATVPCNLHGKIDRRDDTDYFALDLKKGQRLSIRSDTRDMGSAADLELTLYGPDGKRVKGGDDNGFDDAAFDVSAKADGTHLLKVVEVVRKHGPAYVYRIEVNERVPRLSLQSEIGRIAVPRGSWQPVPLQASFVDFAAPIELSLRGAPTGMRLRDHVIPQGENEFVAQLEVDPATPPGIYTLQVVGTATQNDRSLTAIARTQPLVDRMPTGRGPHGEPFELREDQRRLPPSLTDRLAVVVLPEAPFGFEITTPEVVLPRYSTAEFQIETSRRGDYDGEISFVARGGLLEYERLQAPSVKADIPLGTTDVSSLTAKLSSGVNTKTVRHRVTVTGTATDGDRSVHLTRTFYLDVKVAFAPTTEPEKVEILPGESAKVRVLANRLMPFNGPLTLTPEKKDGIVLPDEFVIEAGAEAAEVEVQVAADTKPGTYKLGLPTTTKIGKFFEQGNGTLTVVVGGKPATE